MRHVLVIRLSALGDAAILVPVLRARAAANPAVKFTVAAPPLLEPLFDGMPNVAFAGIKKQQPSRLIYKALRDIGADTVADLHAVNRVDRALLLLRLHHWLRGHFGFRVYRLVKDRAGRRRMLNHSDMAPLRPQWQRYDDVFGSMGLAAPATIPTPSRPHHEGSPRVGLAPFAQHVGKIYPPQATEELALLLANRGYQVALYGSKAESPTLEALAQKHHNISSLAGKLPFADELKSIADLDLMVSMDSANMHFASALGTPVVSIWGATHPDLGFYGYGQPRSNALCAGLDCQPCSAYGRKACRFGTYQCLAAITPTMVANKVGEVLSAAKPHATGETKMA